MRIGFIGLGQMGSGMAGRLIAAGHEVSVYNRSPARAEPLVAQGARLASTPADAAKGEAVVTMVAEDAALETIVYGADGILNALPKGAIHISSSTISVALAERLTADHEKAGERFVSAPVFGRPPAAATGQLFVVAAGEAGAIADAEPIFAAIGQRTFPLSDKPSAANLVKLSGNFLLACVIETLGEAMALTAKDGIDPHQYLELLTSTLFGAPAYKLYGTMIADRAFEPPGFAAPLGQKDIRLVLAAAEALQVPMPVASLLRDRFLTLRAIYGDNIDWAAVGALAARDAGMEK
jgi:3-hydroxyisobutyrate dehydrogenase-like beta-hydroxyacid dehydrogenase